MECPDEQVILDLALGTLAFDARQEAWAHIERCRECAGLVGAALPFLGSEPAKNTGGALADSTYDPPLAHDETVPGADADTVPGPQAGAPPPLRTLAAGQNLRDRYRVVRYIGRGAMGEVYEARHARLVGRYAIKLLNVDLAHSPMARQRFRREAGIASELRHPNIVQVIDFDETETGRPYLVMELLEGRDLDALIAEGPLPLARVLPLARQIAAGLAAMHAQGIVHRDLKPANVFVLPEGSEQPERIKLVDFGLSKRLVPSLAVTHDRMLLGTPQYMAPEQARGNNDRVGAAADQFAMAAILYEMLSGRPAFDGELLSVVLYRIVYEPSRSLADLVPGLPPAVDAAIARGLAKQPGDRFPSVTEMWEALAAGARDAAVVGEENRDRRARVRRRRGWLVLSAGTVGACAAGVGLRWLLSHQPSVQGVPVASTALAAETHPRERRGSLPLATVAPPLPAPVTAAAEPGARDEPWTLQRPPAHGKRPRPPRPAETAVETATPGPTGAETATPPAESSAAELLAAPAANAPAPASEPAPARSQNRAIDAKEERLVPRL
jgi:eukaryotic-like serine/threonine-protein kinase